MEFKCFEVFILFFRTIKVLFNFRPGIIYNSILWDNSRLHFTDYASIIYRM